MMKRCRWLISCSILLGHPLHAESLAGYYLRLLRPEGMLDDLAGLVYVSCGLGSLFSLVLVFQKMQQGDHQAGESARKWCLSLFLVGVCTFIISTLAEEYRHTATVNVSAALVSTTSGIRGSFSVFSRLVYAGCGITGLLLLPPKFYALQRGDRDAGRSLSHWGMALIGTVAMVYIIHNIFFQ
jgi:uncharacterized membrane protein YuzA (DUF378 family)